MNRSNITRAALYAMGEPFGECATRREAGRIVCGGGGSSSQAQTSTYTDNRAVLGQGATNANNGASVSQTSVTSNTTNTYALDNGAINRAFDTTDNTVSAALSTVGSATTNALNFAGDTQAGFLSALQSALAQAFNFASDTQAGALGAIGQAVTASSNAQSDALSTVTDFGGKVLDQVAGDEQALAAAYSDAKGQGAQTQTILIMAVIGALAIAALAVTKKG